MIIGDSKVAMSSSRSYSEKTKTISAESTSIRAGSKGKFSQVLGENSLGGDEMEKAKSGQSEAKADTETKAEPMTRRGSMGLKNRSAVALSQISERADRMNLRRVREQTIMYLLLRIRQILYGEKEGLQEADSVNDMPNVQSVQAQPINMIRATYDASLYEEEETTSFNTVGSVITADGREINFGVELKMSRSFKELAEKYTQTKVDNAMSLVDPLVINLDDNIAELSDQKFYFDLDEDGEKEEISYLNAGSGFLALDTNGDGVINDGSELFGTKSGNGFEDLAKYDSDGNGWIDEADEVFDKLRIWVKDEHGNDRLYKLKDKGVGAICLENVNTNFSQKSLEKNLTKGIIRHTGMFLYEDGRAGTMQHLDMAT